MAPAGIGSGNVIAKMHHWGGQRLTILETISHEVGADVTKETVLEDLSLDSLDFMSLIQRLDVDFKVKIPNSLVAAFSTVGDIVQAVEELQKCA